MKKVIFIVAFVLIASVVFAEYLGNIEVNTNEGLYSVRMWYEGRYSGEEVRAYYALYRGFRTLDKVSNGQMEAARRMLSRYDSVKGDTYSIFVEWGIGYSARTIALIIEFTSNTQFNYWAFIYN